MDGLYSVMQGLESRLGGGEGVEGIYGSITATGMHKVLECMRYNCNLGKNSTLVDIGAGLGRPLLHALLLHGVAHAYGVELDRVKVAKAEAFCRGVLDELFARGLISSHKTVTVAATAAQVKGTNSGKALQAHSCDVAVADDQQQQQVQEESVGSQTEQPSGLSSSGQAVSTDNATQDSSQVSSATTAVSCTANGAAAADTKGACRSKCKALLQPPQSTPIITCASIEQIASLEPASHAYSFWEGVPESGKRAFGRLFREGRTLKAVAVVQRAIRGEPPEAYMAELGFGPLLLIKAFPVKMSGSGRSFQAYVFSKPAPSANLLLRGIKSPPQQQQASSPTCSPTAATQHSDMLLLDAGQASAVKPRKQHRQQLALKVDALGDDAGDTAAAADLPQQQLVQLLTESSAMQHRLLSPGKRQQQQFGETKSAAAIVGQDADAGSPAKKQRGGNNDQARSAAAADSAVAAGAGTGYGLRPRQLSYCSSGLSSSAASSGRRSRSTSASVSTASAAAPGRSRSNNRGSKAATAATATIDSSARSNARSGCVSTAVSGGGSKAARSKKPAAATVAASSDAAQGVAAAADAKRSSRTKPKQQLQEAGTLRQQKLTVKQQQVQPDISQARQAVSALDVTSTMPE